MSERICPICRKSAPGAAYQPFCSRRCADVDLQRWFSGAYATPADARDEGDEGEAPEAGRSGRDLL